MNELSAAPLNARYEEGSWVMDICECDHNIDEHVGQVAECNVCSCEAYEFNYAEDWEEDESE